jgi:hypothetical protein
VSRGSGSGSSGSGSGSQAGLSIDDAAALKGTFSGADGAFLLIPFDTKAPGSAQAESEMKPTYGWIIECHDEARSPARSEHRSAVSRGCPFMPGLGGQASS